MELQLLESIIEETPSLLILTYMLTRVIKLFEDYRKHVSEQFAEQRNAYLKTLQSLIDMVKEFKNESNN